MSININAYPTNLTRRLNALIDNLSLEEKTLVLKAFDLAYHGHRGQKRKDGRAYIEHPLDVALIVKEQFLTNQPEVLTAALLHDVLEDTYLKPQDLEIFSPLTQQIVALVTDSKPKMSSLERKEHYMEIWKHPQATLVKAADRLSNLNDALLTDSKFMAHYAKRTQTEMFYEGSPLLENSKASELLRAALTKCELKASELGA